MRYAEIDEFMAKDNLGELLTEYGIKIICHTGGNNYYDLLNDIEISLFDRDFSDYIYNEQVFAIGTSWQDEYFVNEWLYSLRTYQETSYEFFPIYFYNENNFDLWISEDEYFRTASGTEYFMENIFPDIALAFASGDDPERLRQLGRQVCCHAQTHICGRKRLAQYVYESIAVLLGKNAIGWNISDTEKQTKNKGEKK